MIEGVENPVQVNMEYKDLTDDLIRDRIGVGLRDQGSRSKLLRETNLTLDGTLTFVRSHELADKQLQKLTAAGMKISAIKKNKKQNSRKPKIDRVSTRRSSVQKPTSNKRKQCGFCGTTHLPAECPAWSKKCPHCFKKGHVIEMYYTKKNEEKKLRKKLRKVKSVGGQENSYEQSSEEYDESEDDQVDELFIGAIKFVQEVAEDTKRMKQWIEPIRINQSKMQCKIDTGAECSVISLQKYNMIPGLRKIQSTSTVPRAYNGGKRLLTVGNVTLDCSFRKKTHQAQFFIINKDVNTILGLDSSFKLGFVDTKKT